MKSLSVSFCFDDFWVIPSDVQGLFLTLCLGATSDFVLVATYRVEAKPG